MDEILIEEKKYVSSKRAAKMTGYAKDYVGQLCREGRVPARLVGRSWYVLETAIKDHRFGDNQAEQDVDIQADVPAPESKTSTTWETPHYEASPVDILPSVNRLQRPFGRLDAEDTANQTSEDKQAESANDAHLLQDSWRAWFDHMGVRTEQQSVSAATTDIENQGTEKEENELSIDGGKEDSDVDVPIRVVYEPLPRELLPVGIKKDIAYKQYNQAITQAITTHGEEKNEEGRFPARTIKLLGALAAIILTILALIGSGYFDTYVISFRQVDIISGVTLYNK